MKDAIVVLSLVTSRVVVLEIGEAGPLVKRLAKKSRQRAKKRSSKLPNLHPRLTLLTKLAIMALIIWLTVVVLFNIDAAKQGILMLFLELVILPLAITTVESVIAVLYARRQEMD